jgi:hypothetical protein
LDEEHGEEKGARKEREKRGRRRAVQVVLQGGHLGVEAASRRWPCGVQGPPRRWFLSQRRRQGRFCRKVLSFADFLEVIKTTPFSPFDESHLF